MSTDKGQNGGQTMVQPPSHPVLQLQKPFEESMMESVNDEVAEDVPTDAMIRRTMLLEAPTYQRVIAGRWKQKPGEKYHPLWKLVSQLTFGMHLLSENMAISEEEVMRILQSHVDDIDAFLERTTEDFDLAQSDIHERIRCLKLPLAHGDVFDRMLEDRAFRASILEGNEKIDHVIGRTKRASKDALKDVQKGFDATNVMEKYLTGLTTTWKRVSPEHEAVLVAMLGNVEGWRRAFLELHLQGNKLAGSLKKLAEVVAEMQHRAAVVSRNMAVKAQKPRHITTQAGRAPSQLGSTTEQKPLPSEPGQRHSTRNSSRSTQLTSFSSRPNSGQKSSQSKTSQTQSAGQSPQNLASTRPMRPEASTQSLSSAAAAFEGTQPAVDHMLSLGGLFIRSDMEHPIELPADVPEEALRQAPVSVRNRLSMTLGLRSKDTASHRISSVYYPQALSNLLKSPEISSLLLTPQHGVKGTPVQGMASPIMSEGEAGYFLTHEQTPSIGFVTPDSKTEPSSAKASPIPTRTSARASARASIVGASAPPTRRSSIRSPAFTSHSAVMAMASPPVELPATTAAPDQPTAQAERPSSPNSRKGSEPSSLGEPGPELAEGATTRSASVSEPRILIDTSVVKVAVVPASAEEETFAAAEQKAVQSELKRAGDPDPRNPENPNQPNTEIETAQPQHETVVILPPAEEATHDGATDEVDKTVQPQLSGEDTENLEPGPEPPAPNELVGQKPVIQNSTEFVAELEAVVPKSSNLNQKEGNGPVELEAPFQTFKLPPRPIATVKNPEKEAPRASINQLDDFFKLPSELTIKPGLKPKDFGKSDSAEPIKPLKMTLAKKDGKIVPIQVSSPGPSPTTAGPSKGPKLKVDIVADLIEQISYTPPGSPIHARSSSVVSANSAQRWSHRSTRSLGPPAQAPPPPAPGGRQMVEPDYATAGQFEGERKQKKKKKDSSSSMGSKSAWKTFFRSSSANLSGSDIPERLDGASTPTTTTSGSGSGIRSAILSWPPDGMTKSGKDILPFRKKSLGVLSA